MSSIEFLKHTVKPIITKFANYFYAIDFPKSIGKNIDKLIYAAYKVLLNRNPDPQALKDYRELLKTGKLSHHSFIETIMTSDEFREKFYFKDPFISLHYSRCQFIKSLPRANTILDLGGASQNSLKGALVQMGYPYQFEKLVIVDLPDGKDNQPKNTKEIQTKLGPVTYNYHSMTDLSQYSDESFDMVFSGQSIEHITLEQGKFILKEVFRILKPGGFLCLDTPNGVACRLHIPSDFINIDHEIEYTHEELSNKIEVVGFKILEAKGLNYVGESIKKENFSPKELARNIGIFSDIRNCYILAYVCQK